jgi:hypothetical protein
VNLVSRYRIFTLVAALIVSACAGETQMTRDSDPEGAEMAPPGRDPEAARAAPPSVPTDTVGVAAAGRVGESQPRSDACDESRINVIVREAAIAGADPAARERSLRETAGEIVDRLGGTLNRQSIEISPAIRAFRVSATDAAAAETAADRLRGAPEVESAEVDRCEVMIPGRG